jgi:hypothetical protein
MALTESQKVDMRRHLRYGPKGQPNQGTFFSYRFFTIWGLLEFRMINFTPEEELALIGSGNQSSPANPNFIVPNSNPPQFIDGYLNICNFLESQVPPTTDNLDTDKAGDWTARKEELPQRIMLYNYWVQKMADFIYVPVRRSPYGAGANLWIN